MLNHAAFKMKLKQLRSDLDGDYAEVAKACDVTVATVYRVLNGQYVNMDIIEKAIEVRDRLKEERLQKQNELAKRI